jgi:hypothetical protein
MYPATSILTISLYTLFLCFYTFSLMQLHHIVFEEIGEMAGALSYIHALVPINISRLSMAINNFQCDICHLKSRYKQQHKFYQEKSQGQAKFNKAISGSIAYYTSCLWILRTSSRCLPASSPRYPALMRLQLNVAMQILGETEFSHDVHQCDLWHPHGMVEPVNSQQFAGPAERGTKSSEQVAPDPEGVPAPHR